MRNKIQIMIFNKSNNISYLRKAFKGQSKINKQ